MAGTFGGVSLDESDLGVRDSVPRLAPPWPILGKSLRCFLCKFHHPPPSPSIIVRKISVPGMAEALFKSVISNLSWVRWLGNRQPATSASTAQCPWDHACTLASDVTCFSPAGDWWLSAPYRTRWKALSRLNLRGQSAGQPYSSPLRRQKCQVFS